MGASEAITSLTNPRVKRVVGWRKGHKAREAGVLIAEGWREVERAVGAGLVLVEGYATGAARRGVAAGFIEVTEGVLGKMAYHREPEGVLGVFERPAWGWGDLLEGRSVKGEGRSGDGAGACGVRVPGDSLVAVGMDKPGNLG
ncbi:MAG: hypothetical protein AAF823_15475, partial [Planctomycetota bacterium]